MKMKFRKITALICSLTLAGAMFTGCDDDFWEDEEVSDVTSSDNSAKSDNSSVNLNDLSDIDITQISRSKRENCVPMGKEGTWNIFVYLCGTDLESDGGMASGDIDEMLAVSGSEDIKFIVQTGGTTQWTKDISADKIERYEICNGEMKLVDSVKKGNMGDSDVLTDFLCWGVKEYPAARNGLVLWNHGGGSISGVCFDEYTDDSLLLREIDAALYNTRDVMTDDFEFIGFDACLMGTMEAASILASHSRYMIASEELEPGAGWDYTALGNYLVSNPKADGAQLGTAVCDSYYNACKADESEGDCTLSVIDLSKIDNAIIKFRQFAEDLYNNTTEDSQLSEYVRKVKNQENYGGNSFWEGYSNMVDVNGVISAGDAYSARTADAIAAVNDAVVYMRNGEYHSNSCGLSMYYPLKAEGSEEIKIFKDICVSTHYLAFVDRILYGSANGTVDTYQDSVGILSNLIDWTSSFFGLDDEDEDGGYYTYEADEEYEDDDDDFWSSIFDDWDSYDSSDEEFDVSFSTEPGFDEDGYYSFKLSSESLDNTSSVSAYVYMLSDDEEDWIDLGITSDVYTDWESGEVFDNFDGYWFCLDDGQPLAVYILEEGDGYDIFTSPVLLNGEETNIRFCWDYENDGLYILDIWSGVDENGCCDRGDSALKQGDVITPVYYAYNVDTDEESEYTGYEYTYSYKDCINFKMLPDGLFMYGFCIDDIYGNSYWTDAVAFTVEGEDVYYDDLS